MQFFKSKKFRITKGLLNSNNFITKLDTDVIRIIKRLNEITLSPYFKCIIINNNSGYQLTLLVDELVCNKHTGRISFLNNKTIGDHLIEQFLINDENVSLYLFDTNAILIIIDDMEMEENDTN